MENTEKSKYERFKGNNPNSLNSFVNRDTFAIMEAIYGQRYLDYKNKWKDSYQNIKYPLHVDVDLQDACNMSCNICHQNYRKRTHNIIDFKLIEKVLTDGRKKGLCAINFGAAGEPLLHKEILLKGISLASKLDIMDIFTHTNGLLLDQAFTEKLLDSGLKHLCVSIDAFTKETYEKTRRSKNFDIVVGNLIKLVELRNQKGLSTPTVRVSFCVTPLNHAEKDDFVDFWKNKTDIIETQVYNHVDDNIKISGPFKQKSIDCKIPFKRVMVWPNGDVSLCCRYRSEDVCLGNINNKETNLSDLWQSEKMGKIQKSFNGYGVVPKTCQTCMESNYN